MTPARPRQESPQRHEGHEEARHDDCRRGRSSLGKGNHEAHQEEAGRKSPHLVVKGKKRVLCALGAFGGEPSLSRANDSSRQAKTIFVFVVVNLYTNRR
jgi:hypothetical protein